ncbi:YjiH family protein [Ammoniphilus sp. YIM 78166]|uniref:YjiH family protein n=1 Tax=Ammoniphilus sp. YIM 78166 TaxID=1644106 RepID=UPI00107029A9|nr:YjiH family protein [Ammoniphilus sp. YIM 78166]
MGAPQVRVKQDHKEQAYGLRDYLKFIIPSLIGIFLFMIPIPYQDGWTIPVAIMAKELEGALSGILTGLVTLVMGLALAGTILSKGFKWRVIQKSGFLSKLFDVDAIFVVSRILGFVFALLTYLQFGPEWIWSENTGGLLLTSLIPVLFTVFLFAGLFLPLLLDFGLLELTGALFAKIMRPIFTLPGRSSIDCLASWLGDGTIGVLLTNKQYEDGYYTKREAAVIGTTFSVVSITFSIVVLAQLGLSHMFFQYYLTILAAGLVLAIVMPRIPPLSRKSDSYYQGKEKQEESIPPNVTPFRWGVRQAVTQASRNEGAGGYFRNGFQNVVDMWLGVLPIVMAIGTLSLLIAEYTSFFTWLGTPFIPLLTLLQVPEAAAAAPSVVVGFADMFLPAILGSSIESELTRFVIACLSVTQLIYMSEVGGLLLGSKLPISFKDLVLIFLLRTFISLPIIVFMAHLFF